MAAQMPLPPVPDNDHGTCSRQEAGVGCATVAILRRSADFLRCPFGPGMVRQIHALQVTESVAFQGSHPLEGERIECQEGI